MVFSELNQDGGVAQDTTQWQTRLWLLVTLYILNIILAAYFQDGLWLQEKSSN